jgi:trigger factor
MKANLEKISTLERKLNIHVPAAEVQAAFDKAFKGVQKQATIKGFRQGKAPLATIRSLYGDRIKQDVINDIVKKHYASAVSEHALEPINFPAIEFDTITETADFEFTAEFEIRPEVKEPSISGLEVKKEKISVGEKEVEDVLKDILKSRAQTVPVLEDRPAQNGDIATLDFEGHLATGPLENGSAQNFDLELGGGQFIPGFEEGVEGMKIGAQKDIAVSFPKDYHVAELAGQPVTFKTTLHSLKKKSLPELTDEFVKTLGNYDSVQALRDNVKKDIEEREGKRAADDLKNRLMRTLVERNPVDVPKSLLEEQKKALIEDFKGRLKQQGMSEDSFEEYKDKWDQDFNKTATFMVQSSFLSDAIAKAQNLYASEADFTAKLQEYANQTGLEMDKLMGFYGDQERRSRMMYQITEEKVVDYLISKVKVTEVEKSQLPKDESQS